MSLSVCCILFLAGGLGTVCRYLVTMGCTHFFGKGWPLGTMAANVLGCFFFGLVITLACERQVVSDAARTALCVGFLGGFTTFSSLIFDSFSLGQVRPLYLFLNLVLQIGLGFGALMAGLSAGKSL
ncbi:MAG: CrcB family protein [Desulfovibrionaceae bacterium]|nr:CrcB family protein [Desulfovibrionaceae bacterium]